jgi:hypothetical protein
MCGRYTYKLTWTEIINLYQLTLPEEPPERLKPEQLTQKPYATINARSDRIQTSPVFREPFKKRRCIVPTSGWYEWQKIGAKTKKPFHFQAKSAPFGFAGVYDVWKGDGGMAITSFAIVPRTRHRARSSIMTGCRWCWRRRNSTNGCEVRLNWRQG